MVSKIKNFLSKNNWVGPSLIFLSTVFFMNWFWPSLTFPDGDSFYHIKMTELLSRGIPKNFPWLPFTTLSDHYADHHFLYHVVIYPFVKFIGPFIGIKIATIILASTAFTVFYIFLRRIKFYAPGFFTLLLFTAPTLMLRLSLAKAPPFSFIFIILGLLFIIKQKPIALGILSFLYVWSYGGWPLLPFVAVVIIFSKSLFAVFLNSDDLARNKISLLGKIKNYFRFFWQDFFSKVNLKILGGIFLGAVLGIVINPFFPNNLYFYWMQFFQIAVLNYGSKINVGAEWYGTSFVQMFGSNAIVFIVFFIGLAMFLFEAKRVAALGKSVDRNQLATTFSFLFLSAVFFVLTIRSRRNIEYFIPFFVISISSLFTISRETLKKASNLSKEIFLSKFIFLHIVSVLVFIVVYGMIFLSFRDTMINGSKPSKFAAPMNELKNIASPGSIVFHTDWDNFPLLFYHNDSVRYITGLDATFFYFKDKDRYELWRKIVWNEYVGDVVRAIKENFDASYVFVTKGRDHDLFELQMNLSPKAKKIYEDDTCVLFGI